MPFQSLYRKYRPQRFGELIGQEHVTTALRNAVREGRVGHAYLFSGPRGTGKTTTARILAKALNCLDLAADGEPCGVCENCVAIASGTFSDLVELDAASNRGIDDARDLVSRTSLGVGASAKRKVYILDEAHMLTPGASNTLLKTLEEPPAHVVFVLATTDPTSILPTIRSRTQHFEFTLLAQDRLSEHLDEILAREGIATDDEATALIARRAGGSVRDALSLLDQALALGDGRLEIGRLSETLGGAPFERRAEVIRALANEDVAGALAGVAALVDGGHQPRRVADDLLATLRDAFVLTAAADRVQVELADDQASELRAAGAAMGTALLVRALETLGRAVADMRGTDATDPRLTLEIALVRVARRDAGPRLEALSDRVERIERRLADGSPAQGAPEGGTTDAPPRGRAGPPGVALGALRQVVPSAPPIEASPIETSPVGPPPVEPSIRPGAAARGDDPHETGSLDLDDVIVAWADVLPALPVAARSAVQEAQPISVEGDVVVFGVPPALVDVAGPRLKRHAPAVRAELATRLGVSPKFRIVPHEGFLGGTAADAAPEAPPSPEAPDDADADEESIDPSELVDAPPTEGAVDSQSRLIEAFGATVVEEVPRP